MLWCRFGFRSAVAGQPWWLQAVEMILLSDFLIYWGHRLQHRVPLLWRFHSIHHSAEHLDWLAAHREHPLDTVYTVGLINLPAFLLGFPLETLAGLIAFRGIWAIYIHSNVRLPIGPLRWFIGAPELHHWHHDRARDAGNYANISPLMDIAFGTYRCPDHEPESFGIHEPIPRSYLGQMLHPFRSEDGRLVAVGATEAAFDQDRQGHPETLAAQERLGMTMPGAASSQEHRHHAQGAFRGGGEHPLDQREKQGRAEQCDAGDGQPGVRHDRRSQQVPDRHRNGEPLDAKHQGRDSHVPDGEGMSRMMHGFRGDESMLFQTGRRLK
jgi:hypothetical protein